MHIISLRWKEVKVIGLFVIVYTFIISFHLLRLIDDTGTRELELLRMKSVELNNKGQTVLAVRTENAEHAEEKPMRNDILAKVLLNQVPDLSLQKKKQKPIRAGVRQLEAKNLKSIVHGDAAYDNTYNDDSAQVTPPGFMGAPVIIDPEKLSPEEKELYDKGWSDNTFNQFVSDRIPLSRDLPDLRHPLCRSQTYSWSLPRMSVIICFHNEAWSTLLRTVHSVLKTTHPRLLEEIILVDDASTMVHLKKDLDTHVAKLPKVKVIRSPKREGLVRARLMGTEVAKAEVLTFLDSHCECVMGWAEPQLARVHHDPTVVVWPVIPSIDHSTFEFKHKPEDLVSAKGGFYWDMNFRWEPITEHDNVDRQDITSPVRSPTMAGGLFMINKQFFEHLGTYDPQFELWGGENMELSFKIWMCGGSMEIIPCSLVGHIFRRTSPMHFAANTIQRNSQRVAEIWLDEYKDIYYEHIGTKLADVGDISQRQDLRRDLKCQSFDWYIKNIYPEVFLPSEALQRGTIQSAGVEAFCLDAMEKRAHKKAVQLTQCRKKGMCQAWYLTKLGELRSGYNCLDVGLDPTYATIKMTGCHGQRGNQYWQYRMDRTLYHKGVDGCIAVDPQTKQVSLLVCNNSRAQQWLWVSFNS
ncbi:polypeptide N-acetylgalactosaminyltransferase 5-like isoform X1 [Haliotis rufescens]|uniref:polypeptide N-acetylgalactosaminyltransferase 5-like isoform X1 n=1 Tax=Haliotis rufescens TaxID=6454 RepID=UPI00201F58FC|nr:polypeptide N-acetylgalactosaminyltransferase 5-like isoform X1 [Haliotis rufescens]XP_046336761.2 polypeptide N-acetylgalactosaminyltransferase 5-like isoform X1 [Haliotis rufescens]XP_046336762.2 polypeptide N-acetylgalactosaminyltransferase 5-like isoform X1 [Haliotis rufescens]XP_046336763.2 polypeptide N-acetylgalactosaminyltransferase 5-like isoform X1 [Haliotis rufescens]XP_046336765.2 polypeptide N-acetylgalactosaminyltransferase 5-like isoform X1 [Haliotis rufescens]XP_048242689.1 